MKLRTKLATLIAAFVLVAALTVVGVLAVQNTTINLGGTVNFVATDIKATVTGTATGVNGGTITGGADTAQLRTLTYDAATQPDATALGTWTGLNWTFAQKDGPITLSITVTNNSTERALDATLSLVTVTGSNVLATPTTAQTQRIAASGSYSFDIVLSIDDSNLSVSGVTWSATLTLENVTNTPANP